jgi:hypothetical protein
MVRPDRWFGVGQFPHPAALTDVPRQIRGPTAWLAPYPADCSRQSGISVQQMLYADAMASTIGFRPTDEDQRIIDAVTQATGESASDALRRALRLLDREMWLRQARADMAANASEDISGEPDAW